MNPVSSLTLGRSKRRNTECSRVQTFINAYKRLNSDNTFFGMDIKCLVNSKEQRKRDKHADIY
jgi:hypothetical protein